MRILFSTLMPAARKRIIVSVTNDVVADNRVHKVCSSLMKMGFDVLLVGRKLTGSLDVTKREYSVRRFSLVFNKGPLFYACYNIRLFVHLLLSRSDVLLSNDLDTLPANFLAAKIKQNPLIYDSHEYFTEVPELVHRPVVKRIWEILEKWMVPYVSAAYTVCEPIAAIYTQKYRVPFGVVRNLPVALINKPAGEADAEMGIILYQGAVNEGRGLEQAIQALKILDGGKLVIAGDGDKRKELELLAEKEGLSEKVEFKGKLPVEQLAELTPSASVGLSIEQDIGLNYHYALPNKLFDYIQAQVPVLVTNLPEMAAVVREYDVGEVLPESDPQTLAAVLADMLSNREKRARWKKNLKVAARELVWEKEEKILHQIFSPFL